MGATFMRQLRAILWKNVLLKRKHYLATFFEIAIPVGFIGLLVWIKSICTKRDAPTVAYYCGQTKGFDFYTESLTDEGRNISALPLLQCLKPPDQCTETNYYRGELSDFNAALPALYMEYGYTPAGRGYPFYGVTVADESQVYDQINNLLALQNISAVANNPSPTLNQVTQAYYGAGAVLVICPASATSPSLVDASYTLYQSLLQSLTWDGPHDQALVFFPSEAALEANITSTDYEKKSEGRAKIAAAVVLHEPGPQWDYSIRVNFTQNFEMNMESVGCLHARCDFTYTVPTTNFLVNPFVKPAKADFLFGYTYTAFATLQKAVDDYILNNASTVGGVATTISLGLFPEPGFHSDDFLTVIEASLALFFILAFLYPVSRYLRALVLEKETRIKETMKIMGLSSTAANLAWVITMLTQSLVTVLLMTLLGARTVFSYSNAFLLFIYLGVFGMALVMFCFLVSTFFSKAKTAATAGTVLFFAAFFPYYALTGPGTAGTKTKAAACLLAPTCLGLGADVIAAFEGGLMGLQWNNIHVAPAETNFSYLDAVGMLLFDVLLYGLLAAYLEAVLPSEFGTQLPFYFPLLPSYWQGLWQRLSFSWLPGAAGRRNRRRRRSSSGGAAGGAGAGGEDQYEEEEEEDETEQSPTSLLMPGGRGGEDGDANDEDAPMIEPIDPELRRQEAEGRSLSIRNLRKVFETTSGNRVAVDSLNMDFYEGTLTVLLGHNGAGKSTTISMLTGLLPPTAGEAWVRGKSLTKEMTAIRQNMGLCPQHDTLWKELTVTQHLELFGALKGVPQARLEEEVKRMIQEVDLQEKAHVEAGRLSGGMKRKLSLGMALIGDSKVVLLDEPTSGLDPYSRRQIWSVLERNKRGRVLLLTTHFMDEADMLGDRIAIMADGRLKAMGSGLFLKNKYGIGYTLTIVKEDQAVPSGPLIEAVCAAVPEAETTSEAGAELAFRLPFAASAAFPGLFRELDARKARGELRMSTYGISVTTLLEVFLRIGEDRPNHHTSHHRLSTSASSAADDPTATKSKTETALFSPPSPPTPTQTQSQTLKAEPTFARHMQALVVKRFIYASRDRKSQCCQLVLPALLILLGLSLIKLLGNPLIQNELVLSPVSLNSGFAPAERNPLPVLAFSPVGRAVMEKLDVKQGLVANYIDVASAAGEGGLGEDVFHSCAVGASDLFTMSNYLATTAIGGKAGGASRYGALTFANSTDENNFTYNLLVNASALHGAGVYMNLASNAILQYLTAGGNNATVASGSGSSSGSGSGSSIKTRNHPLPLTNEEQRASFLIQANTASTFVLIAMAFIPASIAIFIVKETESKAKHQQIISGVSLIAYWLANFLWDLISWLAPLAITLALLYAFQIKSYTTGEAAGAFVLLFISFAPAATAFTYVWTFCFANHSAAQTVILFLGFLTGLVLSIVSFVLSLIDSTRAINLKLRYVFRLFPAFCFGDGLLQLALCVDDICPKITADGISITEPLKPLHWDVTMADVAFLLVEAGVYFGLTLLIEYARAQPWIAALAAWRPGWWVFWRKSKKGKKGKKRRASSLSSPLLPPSSSSSHARDGGGDGAGAAAEEGHEEDADVKAEAQRVLTGASQRANDVIRLEKLRKVYQTPQGPKVAVQGLSFGIPRGETFGFLGINGAGKTTTLSMLSGEFPPTAGAAFVAGHSITTEQSKLRKNIGYCPQFSALIDALTTREHLVLFARIKGLPERGIAGVVEGKLKEMDLTDFADKAAGSLSGGNQRKLSMAIATMGDPAVIFADEPSTGMDPASRRFMWDVLSAIRAKQSSIVLTTHSMEEAEALCTRIAIMVNGKLRCVGTPQHLKSKYGEGFELEVKLHNPTPLELEAFCQQRLLGGGGGNGASDVDSKMSNNKKGKTKTNKSKPTTTQASFQQADVAAACATLGHPEWEAEVAEKGSGAALWALLRDGGRVPVTDFAEWFCAEEGAERLQTFLRAEFGPGVVLIERASWFTFRFSLPTGGGLSLADMFEKMEAGKSACGIAEYSLGETHIEVIFNRLCAAGMEEEEAENGQ